MKRFRSLVVVVLVLALLLCGCSIFGEKKIGKQAALQAALADAGLAADQVADVSVEYEKEFRSAWYEVEFESGRTEYEYKVNAYTGEILSSRTD